MSRETTLADLLSDVGSLVKAVRFDEHGEMVAGQWVGGNGGLLSRETMILNDTVSRKLAHWEQTYAASMGYGAKEVALADLTVLFGEALKALDGTQLDQRSIRLFVDKVGEMWKGATQPHP